MDNATFVIQSIVKQNIGIHFVDLHDDSMERVSMLSYCAVRKSLNMNF